MSGVINATLTFDKTSYNVGDAITMTLTGSETVTATTPTPISGSAVVGADDGQQSTVSFPPGATVNVTTTQHLPIHFVSVSDDSGRVWTIDPTNPAKATGTA